MHFSWFLQNNLHLIQFFQISYIKLSIHHLLNFSYLFLEHQFLGKKFPWKLKLKKVIEYQVLLIKVKLHRIGMINLLCLYYNVLSIFSLFYQECYYTIVLFSICSYCCFAWNMKQKYHFYVGYLELPQRIPSLNLGIHVAMCTFKLVCTSWHFVHKPIIIET